MKNIEESSPQLPPSDDPRISECENLTFQHVGTEDGVLATNVLPLEVAMSDSNVNWGSSSGKSAGKVRQMSRLLLVNYMYTIDKLSDRGLLLVLGRFLGE